MSKPLRRFVSDTLVNAVCRVVIAVRCVVLLPVFAAWGNVSLYGLFVQALLIVNFLLPLATCRLEIAAVRFLTSERDRAAVRDRFYGYLAFVTAAAIALAVLLVSCANSVSYALFATSEQYVVVQLCALLLVVSAWTTFFRQFYRIFDQIKLMSIIEVIEAVAATVLVLLSIVYGFGIAGAICSVAAVQLVSSVGMLANIAYRVGWPRWTLLQIDWRPMLFFGVALIPNGLMAWAVNYADRVVIVHFLGMESVGAYAAGYAFGETLKFFYAPLGLVFYPFALRLWNAGHEAAVPSHFTDLFRYYVMAALPASVGVAIVSQPILRLMTNEAFLTDGLLVFAIALGVAMQGLFQLNASVFHIAKKPWFMTLFFVVGALLNVVLNLVLVPRLGLHGAALSTALTFLVLCIAAVACARKYIRYSLNWLDLAKTALASALMPAVLWFLPMKSWAGVLIAILSGVFVFALAMIILRAIRTEDFQRIHRLLQSPFEGSQPVG